MKKNEAIAVIKNKIKEITEFKQVKRGYSYDPNQFPICLIRVPLTEQYFEQSTNKRIPHVHTFDLLLDIIVVSGSGDIEDDLIDNLVEIVKDKMNTVADAMNIIGIEWQHDEEWQGAGNSEQGMTIYYTVQYRNAPIPNRPS